MPRPRTPRAVAETTGADVLHPGRYAERKEPKVVPLGPPPKRLTEIEQQAWSCVFACGVDFFQEASDFTGLTEPSRIWPPEKRPRAEETWLAAARDAWRRVGRIYLDSDLGRGLTPHDRGEPWALVNFGEPENAD